MFDPNLKPYPAYKDSGVEWLGEVPAHWQVRKLRNTIRSVAERNRPDLPLLSVVREKGVVVRDVSDKDENHNFIPDDLTNYKVVKRHQFAMNKMKAWQGSYGVSNFHGIVSPAYFVFDIDGVDSNYFHTSIRSKAYVPYFTRASDGVRIGQWDLSIARMREIPFLVPSVSEQTAIVRFLDHADRRIQRYIRAKQKLIALLEEQKQAIIHQAVTGQTDVRTGQPYPSYKDSGVEWLGEVPDHWELRRLKWVTRLQRGYDLPADRRVPGPFPVVSSGGVIDSHAEARCTGPGVVMGRYGSTDAVYFVEEDFWPHNTSLFVTDFQGNRKKWCYYLLRSITKADQAGKSAVPGLDRKDLFQIVIAVPPVAEQKWAVQSIEAATDSFTNAISMAGREIDLLREYRTRLIADVVTGKLDVREAAAELPEVDPLAEDDLDSTIHDRENSNLGELNAEESAEEYTLEKDMPL